MKDGLGAPQSLLLLGGTSDIGLAVVRALAGGPLRTVVLAGRRQDALESAATDLRDAGVKEVDTVLFDADDTAAHGALIDDVFDRHADIDVVLMAHGVLGDQERAEQDPGEAVRILETNFVGSASLGLHAARRLRQQGHGTLVVLSSVAGERARRANFVYGSSKAGLDAFFQGLGDSLVGTGVRVLIVRPGFVTTKMTDGMEKAPLSTSADEVAKVIVGAIASGKEEVWAPPALRYVMAGVRHLPRPLFRKLKM
jgi:decaprenylphospho-beta-D-erythro-pentofuranosid-2-ulose 2-reductase